MACARICAPSAEEGIVGDEDGVGALADETRKRRLDLAFRADRKDEDPLPHGMRRRPHVGEVIFRVRISRIGENGDDRCLGDKLADELQSLAAERAVELGHSRRVAARLVEARDHAELDRIGAHHEHDGNRRGGGFGRERRRQRACEDDRGPAAHEFDRLPRQAIVVALRPAVFDRDVCAVDISRVTQGLAQRGQTRRVVVPRLAAEISDHRHRRLLRARRERPRHRAAEKRNELAPLHSITSSARSNIDVGIVTPIALAVRRFTTSSNVVGCSTGKSAGLAPRRILST